MDKQNFITRINGADIVTVDKDGETYVPIKPICEAIGVDAKSQRAKLQEDEFFASVGAIITSTGSDGKPTTCTVSVSATSTDGSPPSIRERSLRRPAKLSLATAASATMSSTSTSHAPCSAPSRPIRPKSNC